MDLIKDRWDGFAISLAAFIHNNTDVIVLTLFTDLKVVSVYSVYSLVTSGLKQLIKSFSNGIVPSIGNVYAKGNKEELNKSFEIYEYMVLFLTFLLFSVGGVLITKFVLLYTRDIDDINYNQPLFGLLLILAESISCIREPYLNLAFSANKFREIRKSAYIEAFLNIIISLILVFRIGLIGVAIGTLISMIYRTIYQVVFLKKSILKRNVSVFVKKIGTFTIFTITAIAICLNIGKNFELSIMSWILEGIIYTSIFVLIYFIMSVMLFKKEFAEIKYKLGGK